MIWFAIQPIIIIYRFAWIKPRKVVYYSLGFKRLDCPSQFHLSKIHRCPMEAHFVRNSKSPNEFWIKINRASPFVTIAFCNSSFSDFEEKPFAPIIIAQELLRTTSNLGYRWKGMELQILLSYSSPPILFLRPKIDSKYEMDNMSKTCGFWDDNFLR